MDKFKRFIDVQIPTNVCNLSCHYCYVGKDYKGNIDFKKNTDIFKLEKKDDFYKKVFSVERWGGICFFNLCATGETLLGEDILRLARIILECGHYLQIVTNGLLTEQIKKLLDFSQELKERLFLKISFHFLELKKLNIIDKFFDNVDMVKNQNVSFSVELTANDETIPYIDELKEVCLKNLGALCHVTVARDAEKAEYPLMSKYTLNEFKSFWSDFKSDLFNIKVEYWETPIKDFCYAGEWSALLNFKTGELSKCYWSTVFENVFENVEKTLCFEPIGTGCVAPHCFNCHSFLSLGTIPEYDTVTYADTRNRITATGEEWLTPKVKAFFSQKLKDNNREYTEEEKYLVNIKSGCSISVNMLQKTFYENYNDVFVYGAGYKSRKIILWLKQIGVNVKSVLVTDKSKNPKVFLDLPVMIPQEANINAQTDLILIGSVKFYDEIKAELEKFNFKNVISAYER